MKCVFLPTLLVLFTSIAEILTASDNHSLRSLAFIFDVTGSMNSELAEVKEGATKIFKTLAENKKKIIQNYIFVPFNDPLIGPSIDTTNTTEFSELIKKIRVDGGDDCPEMSLGGIKKGLELCLPNSLVYVFTDADPKDISLLPAVLELIQSKKAKIVFLLTGYCHHSAASQYETIATTSGGQIFDMSKHDVETVLQFIRLSLPSESDKVNLLSIDSRDNQGSQNSNSAYSISIDEGLREITTALTGENIVISFTDPSGQQVSDSWKIRNLLNLDKVKVTSIQNPTPGMWKIDVGESQHYALRVTGQSDFDFNYGFSIGRINSMNDTNQRPLIGFKNNIFIQPNIADYLSTLISCEMITVNGSVMQTVAMIKVTNIDNLFYGTFTPTETNFYVRVNGVTKKGAAVQRISTIPVSPTATTEKPVIQGEVNVATWTYGGSFLIISSLLVSYVY